MPVGTSGGVHQSRPAVQLAALRQPKANGQVACAVPALHSTKVWPAFTGSNQQGPIYHIKMDSSDKVRFVTKEDTDPEGERIQI